MSAPCIMVPCRCPSQRPFTPKGRLGFQAAFCFRDRSDPRPLRAPMPCPRLQARRPSPPDVFGLSATPLQPLPRHATPRSAKPTPLHHRPLLGEHPALGHPATARQPPEPDPRHQGGCCANARHGGPQKPAAARGAGAWHRPGQLFAGHQCALHDPTACSAFEEHDIICR